MNIATAPKLKFQVALLLALALIGAALVASSSARKSVTVDEYAYLPKGLALLKTGLFRIDPGVAPLPVMSAALPLLFSNADFDVSRLPSDATSWDCGFLFQEENRADYHRLFLLARRVSMLPFLLAGFLAYGFARSLYGWMGGLVAAVFVFLSPELIAHAGLATADVHLTAACIGSFWALDRLLRKPDWIGAGLLGFGLGAASLSKLTGVLFFAIIPLAVLVLHLRRRFASRTKGGQEIDLHGGTWLALLGAILFGWGLIHLGYYSDPSFLPLEEFSFRSGVFRAVRDALPGWLPVPFPYHFFSGLDAQLAEKGYQAYLLGHLNREGFWYYYLVGLLVKTPDPVLILAVAALYGDRAIRDREFPMILATLSLLVFFSFAGHKNIGMRYIMFIVPVMAVWIGRIPSIRTWRDQRERRLANGLLVGGALWMAVSAFVVWPDYLAYFNLASGGPSRGHNYLLDSNLDWGQDLIALRNYMDRERLDSLDLAYFGRVDPSLYGIHYRALGAQPPQRYAAISANLLWGRMYFVNGGDDWPADPETYAAYRTLKPKAILGHTISVFDISAQENTVGKREPNP